jgi:hypothetical protein
MKMVEQAKAGSKDHQFYICDRILGRPHQSIDNRIKGEIQIDYGAVKVALLNQINIYKDNELNTVEIKQIEEKNDNL